MAVTKRQRQPSTDPPPSAKPPPCKPDKRDNAVPAWRKAAGAVMRAIVILVAFRLARFYFKHSHEAAVDTSESYSAAWKAGEGAKLYVYLSEQTIQTRFVPSELYYEQPLVYGKHGTLPPITIDGISKPKDRLYAHLYLCRNGADPDPDKSGFKPLDVAYKRVALMSVAAPSTDPIKRDAAGHLYWYPKLHICVIAMQAAIKDISQTPPQYRPHMSIDRSTRHYLPTLYTMEQWQLKRNRVYLHSISDTGKLSLTISAQGRAVWWFKLMSTVGLAIEGAQNLNSFMADEYEQIKELLTETATWLLLCTVAVSILHSVFDFMAFKNDVQFWRKRDTLTGVSVRSIAINIVSQSVIAVYLVEQRASWVVIGSAVVGVAIEGWKASKVVRFDRQRWRLVSLQRDQNTEQYDKEAISLLTKIMFPLLVSYYTYSFVHHNHRNWASFAIQTAVGFVYAFGFVLMTPQLYVNYKRKSVAHLPWRVFCYKALNTVVDDLFAFAIKMPWMHRLACFRDDLIFVVYLYQMWVYPVDRARVNEFGQSFASSD